MGTHPIFESDFDCLTEGAEMGEEPNPLYTSFTDPSYLSHVGQLNHENVLDYFSNTANPFYERQCNNQVCKMQNLSLSNLVNMSGIEYGLIHYQDPILYIIQKRKREQNQSGGPSSVTPLAHY